MRKRILLLVVAMTVLLFSMTSPAAANSWEDVFRNLSAGDVITPGTLMSENVFKGHVFFAIFDYDGVYDNFKGADTIDLKITGNGVVLNFFGTKKELTVWAKEHRKEIMKALFGSGTTTGITGTTNASNNIQNLMLTVETPLESSGDSKGFQFAPVSTKDIVLKTQYDFLTVGAEKNHGSGSSGILTYERKFGENASNSIGIGIPYRQFKLDDNLDSEYTFASFMPYYKHRWYTEKSVVEWFMNLTLNATYLKATIFPDGNGFFEYGGGTGIRYGRAISPNLDMTFGLAYQTLKKQLSEEYAPKEMKWFAMAINDLPLEHNIVPSIGMVYKAVPGKFTIKADVFRIHQIQSDVESGMRYQTVAAVAGIYKFSKLSELTAGYKTSFEVKDLKDHSVSLAFRFGWR